VRVPGKIKYYRPPGQALAKKAYERAPARQEDKNFYSTGPWPKLRRYKLSCDPVCEECRRQGRVTLAVHVHHKKARKDRPDLALDVENLESLCAACHNAMEVR
jgi:5-methylcytosine-specific restriction enzyme A